MKLLTNNNLIQTDFIVKTQWDQGFTGRLDFLNTGAKIEGWQIEFESPLEIAPDQIWGAKIVSHEGDRYILEPVDYNKIIDSQQTVSVVFNADKINGEIVSPENISFENAPISPIEEAPADVPATEDVAIEEASADVPATEDVAIEEAPADVPATENAAIEEPTAEDSLAENTLEDTTNSGSVTTPDDAIDSSTDVDFTLVNDWGSGFEGKISITNNGTSNIDSWSLEFDFANPINNIWDAQIESNQNGNYVITHEAWNREIKAGETLSFTFTGENSVSSAPQNFDLDGSTFSSPSTSDSIYTFSNSDLKPELELDQNYQGRATFYDAANPAGGLGASGYDIPTQSELHKIVAINNVQWNGSEASGAFFEVSGPKQRDGAAPITVQVVDYLYERADGFDMSAEAFEKVANPVDGVVNINYQLVGPADDYVTAYGYSIGQGIVVEGIAETSPYYAAVRLNNHRYPIESVELLTEAGDTIDLNRESDNRFVLEGNYPLSGAQDLVVTDIFGQEVTLDDIDITNGSSADTITGEQFEMI